MPSIEELQIAELRKEVKELRLTVEHLERFIFLDEKGLKQLYETHKKITKQS